MATFYTFETWGDEAPGDEISFRRLAATDRHNAWVEARERFQEMAAEHYSDLPHPNRRIAVVEQIGTVGLDDEARVECLRRRAAKDDQRAKAEEANERATWQRLNQKFGGT